MSLETHRTRDTDSLFAMKRQVFSNGASAYFCLPQAAIKILNLNQGDEVVIHELDGGDLELFPTGSPPRGASGIILSKKRKIQSRDNHSSLFCNVPKMFNFEVGDDVDVVVHPDRIRIQPATDKS